MIPSMAPAWWHKNIQELIFDTRCFSYISYQTTEFSKITVQETIGFHLPGDAIFNRYIPVQRLIGAENTVPYIQQVTKICIHIQWIFGVVYPVMRWRKDKFTQESKPAILNHLFAD